MADVENSNDQTANTLESLPRRVFLDTNVVNLIVKFPEQIFENGSTTGLSRRDAIDCNALAKIFCLGQRAGWELIASNKSIEELKNTPDQTTRSALLGYAFELFNLHCPSTSGERRLSVRLEESSLFHSLPDANDRELIADAIGFGCQAFCTRDHRTILRKRHLLPALRLRIVSPVEWWSLVQPWAGLWG